MATCPTCSSTVPVSIDQPTAAPIPSIPIASDLPSALAAIQALSMTHNIVYGYGGGGGGSKQQPQQSKNNTKPPQKPKVGRFEEQKSKRITTKVKVYSKQDKETFVEYKQINGMTFKDTITGETWNWSRGSE